VKIICLGDSLTFGYQVTRAEKWHVIAAKKAGIQMVNRGINGDTTADMLGRIKQQEFDAKPDGVILMGGHNDIFFNRSWDRAAQNMRTMVDQSRANNLLIFVAIPPPIHLPVAFKEGGRAARFRKIGGDDRSLLPVVKGVHRIKPDPHPGLQHGHRLGRRRSVSGRDPPEPGRTSAHGRSTDRVSAEKR